MASCGVHLFIIPRKNYCSD